MMENNKDTKTRQGYSDCYSYRSFTTENMQMAKWQL